MIAPDKPLARGTIMQLNPDPAITRNAMFCACMFVVTESKPWGAQGYVQGLGENGKPAGQAYYRAEFAEMEPTAGRAEWMPGGWDEDGEPAAVTEYVVVERDELNRLITQIERNTELLKDFKP